jgi:endonuclease/exonuclease/phosphatase family metal-dependent hydrolase
LVGRLPNGSSVAIVESVDHWNRIHHDGDTGEGWVISRYLRPCASTTMAPQPGARAAPAEQPELILCWWNARRLGHGDRDWELTEQVLSNCDVVGLGEVMTPEAAGELARHLGPNWTSHTSSRNVGARIRGYREYYAVVYDGQRVTLSPSGARGFYPDTGDLFVREPWAITLQAGQFDFTLLLWHATWGASAAERQAEVQQVGRAISWFRTRGGADQDLIVLGDFNRTPDDEGWQFLEDLDVTLLVTGAGTTVNRRGERCNLYDNIVIDDQRSSEWTGRAGAIQPADLELAAFRALVSDHLPVWASFDTNGPDDD